MVVLTSPSPREHPKPAPKLNAGKPRGLWFCKRCGRSWGAEVLSCPRCDSRKAARR